MSNEEDPIQEAIDNCTDELIKLFMPEKPGWVTAHFLCGVPELPGYIRRSALRAISCDLATWASNICPDEKQQKRVHRRVMLEHVRAFERSHTLLNLAAKVSKELKKDILFEINVTTGAPNLSIEFKDDNQVGKYVINCTNEIANYLAPQHDSKAYLEAVYNYAASPLSIPTIEIERATQRFLRARGEVYGRLLSLGPAKGYLGKLEVTSQ